MSPSQLEQFAEKTPVYVYDRERIRDNFRNLQSSLPAGTRIYYSLKANPHPDIVSTLLSEGAFFDVSSLKELETTLSAGVDAHRISFVGPAKTSRALAAAVKLKNALIVVESSRELRSINELATQQGQIQDILLRLQLKEWYDFRGQLVPGKPSQFGICESTLPEVMNEIDSLSAVRFCGFHNHVQSQILSESAIANNFLIALDTYQKHLQSEPTVLGLGGGFGIPYFSGQSSLDFKETHLKAISKHPLIQKYANAQLSVESGRYLVGDAGYFLTRVVDLKTSKGADFAITDGGLSNHLALAGFGQTFRKNYQIQVLGDPQRARKTYTITGPSCYTLDVLAQGIELPELQVGDVLCVQNSGAYGKTFSPTGFLGLPVAEEVFI